MHPKTALPVTMASLWFNVLEGSMPKILKAIDWMQGILEPPPISSSEWIGIDEFLDWKLDIEAAMSAKTETIML